MPDFGTWHPNVENTREAIIDRMAIEVNGRMYTETPTAGMNMYVDTALEVGGTNSGNDRPGHTALVRSDTKDKRANNNASNTALDNDKGRFRVVVPGLPSRRRLLEPHRRRGLYAPSAQPH